MHALLLHIGYYTCVLSISKPISVRGMLINRSSVWSKLCLLSRCKSLEAFHLNIKYFITEVILKSLKVECVDMQNFTCHYGFASYLKKTIRMMKIHPTCKLITLSKYRGSA